MIMLAAGSAHGRFQPLHNGHLEYLLAAKRRCEFLWIGITQFNVKALAESPADRHRESPSENPLTYFERVELIIEAMVSEGVGLTTFGLLPFPIETPDVLHDFLPTTIPIFTTVYEDWNRYKIEVLRSRGYDVRVLWEREKKVYEGVEVRHRICIGDSSWRELVPPATVRAVEKYKIRERLLSAPPH